MICRVGIPGDRFTVPVDRYGLERTPEVPTLKTKLQGLSRAVAMRLIGEKTVSPSRSLEAFASRASGSVG
jgi:hypothetical protein